METTEIIALLLSGAGGAIFKTIINDKGLKLPTIQNEFIYLGFIGSIIIGATIGIIVDHSPLTAFFAGYTGFSTIDHLMPKIFSKITKK